jgi:hypothetical protein
MDHLGTEEKGYPLSRQQAAVEAVKTGFPDDPETIKETFDLLLRHDIITETETGIRFASELMRRWVDTKQDTKY